MLAPMGVRALIAVAVVVMSVLAVAAAPAQGARAWRAPLELSAPGADAWIGKEVPALSVMPNGTAVTAWREGTADSSAVKVLEKPPGAAPVGPQTLGGGANPPSVATTLDGRAYVAWVGTTGNDVRGESVLVAERLEGGGYGMPRELATTYEGYSQPGTAVAANAYGDAVVLFTTGSWNDQRLWSARRTRDGQWHEPQPVTDPIGEAVWRLHAGMSETGEAVFAWLSWDPDRGTSAWTAIEPADGPAHDVRRMQSPGDGSTLPSLAVDRLGNAIVSWTEQSGDNSVVVGDVRAAVRAPGEPFGAPIDLHGSAFDMDPTTARLSDDGHAIVAWQGASANGANGASLSGAMTAVGTVPAGAFTPPEQVSSSWLVDTPLTAAVDPVGNAAYFWVDWDTGEQRVVRRAVTGIYGQERAVVACPRTRTYPIGAGVDPLGNASLLWTESNFNKAAQALRLSQDEPATTFSPDPCPAPPPPLVWTPKDPAVGDSVTFDASGLRDPAAARTTFKWDLDGDGVFETDTGETPTATHMFAAAGEQRIGLQVSVESQRAGNGSTSTCPYTIRIGSPPQPPNEYPAYWADPKPPDQPDENPWPVAPAVEVPPLPPVPPIPVGQGLPLPTTSLLDRPGASAAAIPVTWRGLVIEAASSIPARALIAQGIPVRLTSSKNEKVRLRLLRRGGRAGHRTVAGPVTVQVPVRRTVIVQLKPGRAGRGMLRARGVRSATLEALVGSRSKVLQRVRIR
jgi:hypothetical protein